MSRTLEVLLVEDNPDDAELVTLELIRAGYTVAPLRVETAGGMEAALGERAWDIILSDFSMPTFSAMGALSVLKASGRDIPLIIVSGTIGEETAVAALKAGAHDFLVKTQLARLVPAIEREIRECRVRRVQWAVQQALRTSEERFRAIMQTAPDAVLSADSAGTMLWANPAAERMFGYRTAEMLGEPFTLLLPERHREPHRETFERFLTTGEPSLAGRKLELVGRRRDGTEFPVDLAVGSWESEGARFFAGFVEDLTDRKTVEAQLLMAERMAAVGVLAAGVAHEINNPLAAVIASLELAGEDLEGVERSGGLPAAAAAALHERLRDAQEAADRVRQTVRDLKIFSRGEDESRGPVDVERVMEATLRMAANEIRHRARLVKSFSRVAAVEASEARLGQVFLNLLMNAAQALPEGDVQGNEIRVVVRGAEGKVIVEIGDTGCGIPPEVLRRLFTPFVTTKPVGVGTGLGLSICHRIVTDLGGAIGVDTEVGKGTVFTIALPAARATAEPPSTVEAAPVAPGRQARVLVIDDEPRLGRLIEGILAEHAVTVLTSAREALAVIEGGERFEVILCDLMMPEMTGVEFHEGLAARAPEQAARVVFMTGGAFTPRTRTFLDATPNARLEKPFNARQLRALVAERAGADMYAGAEGLAGRAAGSGARAS